jgi:Outer membrane protein and related peptidoglycan-associated (lipo)proteins
MKNSLVFCLLLFHTLAICQEAEPLHHIKSVYFGGGNYYIDAQQQQEIKEFLESIPDLEGYDISVHSHTDNIGSKEYNAWLSEMRSEAAIREIMKLSIDRETISIEDFGELNPVYDNSTLAGRLRNRRVDIILKKPLM